jgi:hypothetical protein
MKISKFVWSVLVAFVGVGLVAPQEAGADFIGMQSPPNDIVANITPSGNATIVTFNSPLLVTTNTSGVFIPGMGHQAIFKSITWFGGNGLPPALEGAPIISLWSVVVSLGTFYSFDLEQLQTATSNVEDQTASLLGIGTVHVHAPGSVFSAPASFFLGIEPPNPPDFVQVNALTDTRVSAPDGGSALGLLAIGLIGLVAVEGLRRKLATRQNRYA